MTRFFKILISIFGVVLLINNSTSVYAQDTKENRRLIENTILAYYFQYLRSEQGSLASFEQQRIFKERGFYDKEDIDVYLYTDFKYNLRILNKILNRPVDNEDIMWGDMTDAEYFTLHFDEIKFSYPHMAIVKAHIDYGVRTVDMVYDVFNWNDVWRIYDVSVTTKPLKFMDQYIKEYDFRSDPRFNQRFKR